MDRNHDGMLKYRDAEVALRKESVDRNHQPTGIAEMGVPSLSARRAWIEIIHTAPERAVTTRSLSARRAWIEIYLPTG